MSISKGILVLQEVEVEELTAHVAECITNGYGISHRPTAPAVVVVAPVSSL